MLKLKFVCKRCGYSFAIEVFEPGEAEEKRVNTKPVRCPKCGGQVERYS